MAGTNPNFPAADVRAAIRNTAKMAAPNDQLMTPTFRWDERTTFTQADSAGRPYNFNDAETPVTDTTITDLELKTVVAVVERVVEAAEGTRVGMFRGNRCTLTVVDVDYHAIVAHGSGRFADAVIIGDSEYRVEPIPKPDSIFDLDVWSIHAFAQAVAKPL